jgi:hypothetical protein
MQRIVRRGESLDPSPTSRPHHLADTTSPLPLSWVLGRGHSLSNTYVAAETLAED